MNKGVGDSTVQKQQDLAALMIKQKLQLISEFLTGRKLITMIADEQNYNPGDKPPELLQTILTVNMKSVLGTLKQIYVNSYKVQQLPNMCYFFSCKINLSQLLSYL